MHPTDDLDHALAAAGVLAATHGESGLHVNAAGTAAELYLSGEVGFDITAAGVLSLLKDVPKGAALTIRINSGGGSAFEGVAVFNALRRAPQQKTVVVEALVASAASIIAMAADRIEMPANTFLMIHRAWAMALGNRNVMAEMQALLDRVDGVMADTYAARSGQPRNAIIAAMDAETWFSAEEAVAFRLADAVQEPLAVAASALDPARYRNAPASLLASAAVPVVPSLTPAAPAASKEPKMSDPVIDPAAVAVTPTVPVQPAAATVADLKALATRAGLDDAWVVAQASAGVTIEAARDAAIDAVASERARPIVTPMRDEGDTKRQALQAAFDYKIESRGQLPEIAADYRGARWMDIARECVALAGGNVRGAKPMDIARAAMNLPSHAIKGMATTSDFPGLLANNMSKRLLAAYDNAAEARNFLRFAFERRVPDFKTVRTVEIGMAPSLVVNPEGAEVQFGTIGEASQTYTIAKYSRRQALSLEALVNDDLAAFDRLPQAWANSAANLEASLVWGLFNTNGNLADGTAWFAAGRSNTAAGTTSVDSIGAARAGIRRQTDATGQRILVTPSVIICAPEAETAMRALLAPQVVPTSTATTAVNPWLGAFGEPVVGHYLTDTNDFYVTVGAGSGYEPVEVAYLEGENGPMIETFTEPSVLGITTRCTHFFATAAVTGRTIYRITQ